MSDAVEEKKRRLKTLVFVLTVNCLITVLLGYLYILYSTPAGTTLGAFFIRSAWISNFVQLYLIFFVIFYFPFKLFTRTKILYSFLAIFMSLFQILTFLDTAIYRIYKIHFNGMVINLLTTEGAGDVLHLGNTNMIILFAVVIAFIILEFFLVFKIQNRASKTKFGKRRLIIIAIILVTLIMTDKVIYAVGDLYNVRTITRHTKIFPLYQIVTIKSFMRKYFGFELDREKTLTFDTKNSILNYPKEKLVREPLDNYPNIIWIVMDAWRYDMLDSTLAPNIHRFSKKSQVFINHFSGGNATRFGIFSMFTGVYGYYWHQFLGERQSSVMIDELIDLGYDFRLISASQLTYPEFRKTIFVKIPESISDKFKGVDASEKDPQINPAFYEYLQTRDTTKPFFSFLFYDAPHGPYRYPKEFDRLQPSKMTPNYLTLSKDDVLPVKNSYKNAIYFDDFLIGQILDSLSAHGLMNNTVIIVTGDHGEEFYEMGFYGHTSSFSRCQTQVPLIMYLPGVEPRTIDYMTSHHDLVPTTLTMLGYTSDPDIYCHGRPMLTDPKHEYVFSSGWDDCAIITHDYIFDFPFETYNAVDFEVRTAADYKLIEDDDQIFGEHHAIILNVLREFEEFMK
ncbi:MAG: sulfatase-like hydrolase/transferase [Candidatus Zixiibacteriota bacterium]